MLKKISNSEAYSVARSHVLVDYGFLVLFLVIFLIIWAPGGFSSVASSGKAKWAYNYSSNLLNRVTARGPNKYDDQDADINYLDPLVALCGRRGLVVT